MATESPINPLQEALFTVCPALKDRTFALTYFAGVFGQPRATEMVQALFRVAGPDEHSTEPTSSDPINPELAAWQETARLATEGREFYRGLLRQIGELYGQEAFVADDGSEQTDVIVLKVKGLVERDRATLHALGLEPETEVEAALVRFLAYQQASVTTMLPPDVTPARIWGVMDEMAGLPASPIMSPNLLISFAIVDLLLATMIKGPAWTAKQLLSSRDGIAPLVGQTGVPASVLITHIISKVERQAKSANPARNQPCS